MSLSSQSEISDTSTVSRYEMDELLRLKNFIQTPKFNYRDGVRIGNWFEDSCKYVHSIFKHDTIYNTDYTGKPTDSQVTKTEYWDNIVQGDGIERALMFDHEDQKYYENYSATTDLAYNWLPHCKRPLKVYSTVHLTYIPQQDYALNYGNVTNFDLRKVKNIKWRYETLLGSDSWTTECRDNYLKPESSYYTVKRKAIPREMSSKINEVNNCLKDYVVRGKYINLVPEYELNVLKRDWPHYYF